MQTKENALDKGLLDKLLDICLVEKCKKMNCILSKFI